MKKGRERERNRGKERKEKRGGETEANSGREQTKRRSIVGENSNTKECKWTEIPCIHHKS